MSYYWTLYCETDDDEGPKIRVGHNGLKFGAEHTAESPPGSPVYEWLCAHEHHEVRLVGEPFIRERVRSKT